MPDQPFAELYRDTEDLTWASIEHVRRRGRQRTRRTRAAAALSTVVAVAVVAAGAAVLADNRDAAPPLPPATNSPAPTLPATPTPTTPTPTTPTPGVTPSKAAPSRTNSSPGPTSVEIPSAAMLRVADLPDGFRSVPWVEGEGDWSLAAAASALCRNQSPRFWMRDKAERGRTFSAGREEQLVERVRRYELADAKAVMDWARRLVTGCQPTGGEYKFSFVDTGFAGDESLLAVAVGDDTPSQSIILRRGNLVAEIWLKGGEGPDEARRIAQQAAERLCVGTDAC
ncbi:hypothetical protein [Micromonospora sp. KLBMP9576]|uniref:hypothetical protein n=1 Tax=Micromonospora sp. KLBMP9576 TaxID=3424769 RepID=UPI003D91DFBE